jgi:ribosomal protein L9
MKYILVTNAETFGAFAKIEKVENGYLCDNLFIPDTIAVEATITEVDDAWVNPIELANQKAAANDAQSKNRFAAYTVESDPIFFKSQRGEATNQEWLDAIAAIDARFPYQE